MNSKVRARKVWSKDHDKRIVKHALAVGYNKVEVAKILRKSRETVYRYIRELKAEGEL